ncbi:histone-lysine N-methyltransferase SETDB2 isoform X2 [Kryptolebias marmoratus]|uniref:Histone-lysine N-methyltransferase SETDB2 n=1 Tax=Kryptolebias marmoratus TaxID=37003 RepID=A0A3Q3AJ63_KRYMA|nr:histone-lysine N-methyltransferase SETDB2 isoform X2 [Kryptolebias marmoratus]
MEDALDPRDVEHAKTFWAEEDVDQVFSGIFEYLDHLKRVLQKKTATDKEYVQAVRLLESLDCLSLASHQDQDSSVVQVVIGSGGLLPADFPLPGAASSSSASPARLFNGPTVSAAPSAGREELLPPLVPVQLEYHPHCCCKACLPRMPQSSSPLCGQNPLKVPLLCGFKRLTAKPLMSPTRDGEGPEEDVGNWDVIYKAPCGQSLCNYDDVMCFLSVTESYDILQVDFFTFSHLVQLDPPMASGQPCLEEDLSRGAEPMPVELCVGDGGARPSDFRYRKDRWPHGCFLSRGPKLFHVCCDCSDGCCDAEHCACVAMTIGGRGYSHHRLLEPVASGLYECGPWCGCDRSRCQNRLVQRGIRVRLQVFQTGDRGWGVRCRDDLDRGTFVCIFAGVVLQRVQSPVELQSPKLFAADLPSDDEVEVVTEWLAPPVLEGRRSLVEMPPPVLIPASLRLNVPVIQRPAGPAGSSAAPQDQGKVQEILVGGPDQMSPSAGDLPQVKVSASKDRQEVSGSNMEVRRSLKRGAEVEDVCLVDASKEGNVSRFINHSCQPNLFIQNVFTDSHDPAFPVIAFFTDRVLKAGAELTWNYSAGAHGASGQKQEVPCLCRSDGCRGWLQIEENLCNTCDVGGPVTMETT